MEKASSFFVIIINDLYDEVIYVNFKEIGKMLVTLSIIATAIYVLVEHTRQWPSIVVLAIILALWLQLVYHLFHKVKFSNKDVIISSDFDSDDGKTNSVDLKNEIIKLKKDNEKLSSRIEEVNNRITKLHPVPPKMTFDDSIRLILYMNRGLNTKNTTYNDVRSDDSTFASFCSQIAYAKQHNIEISSSKNYRKVLNIYLNVISNHLLAQLILMYDNNVNSFKDTIKKALNQYPYSKETLLAVRDELIGKYGKKSQCTLLFEEIIKKLDKMY